MWRQGCCSLRVRIFGIFAIAIAFMAGSTLYVFFEVIAISRMSFENVRLSSADELIDGHADRILFALGGISVIACMLAGWMAAVLRNKVTRPLVIITDALTELARGKTDMPLPETNRFDEIGRMADAFEVFRQNAAELRAAHLAADEAHRKAMALARHDALTGLPNRSPSCAALFPHQSSSSAQGPSRGA